MNGISPERARSERGSWLAAGHVPRPAAFPPRRHLRARAARGGVHAMSALAALLMTDPRRPLPPEGGTRMRRYVNTIWPPPAFS
jgi:hypothetical protein